VNLASLQQKVQELESENAELQHAINSRRVGLLFKDMWNNVSRLLCCCTCFLSSIRAGKKQAAVLRI